MRQGGGLWPTLFSVDMDHRVRRVMEGKEWAMRVWAEASTDLKFADDVVLLVDTCLVLVGMVRRMEKKKKKLQVTVISRNEEDVHPEDIVVRGDKLCLFWGCSCIR